MDPKLAKTFLITTTFLYHRAETRAQACTVMINEPKTAPGVFSKVWYFCDIDILVYNGVL